MSKARRILICSILAISIAATCFTTTCFAAGKTVAGYKNTTYSNASDAYAFAYGVSDYVSSYATTYKYGYDVSNSDFYDTSKAIKYWAAHGNNTGHMWGTANDTDINIFTDKSKFSWAGGNLEFVFLAACKQLDGLGSNPRAQYARAMIGDKAVRTVCGYHEAAPATVDVDIAKKFLEYAKTQESAKSSWILANSYYADLGWSTRDYLVLTHSGNVQYSRFEGFSNTTYPRPTASSKTILRFSSTGSNTQPINDSTTLHGMNFYDDITYLQKTDIPTTALVANQYTPQRSRSSDITLLTDEYATSAVIAEVGHTPVRLSEEDARSYALEWVESNFAELPSDVMRNDNIEVAPIVMAEVNLDGGEEIEYVVAYSVKKNNLYKGIPIVGDHCNVIVDDEGAIFTSVKWSDYSEIENGVERSANESISFDEAAVSVKQYLTESQRYLGSLSEGEQTIIEHAELVYAFNNDTQNYQPCWKFVVKGYATLLVNCFTGDIVEM